MKKLWITLALSSMVLFSCGGSEGVDSEGSVPEDDTATETLKNEFIANLSNTSWEQSCIPYHKSSSEGLIVLWNVKVKLSIDDSLKSTYRTAYYRPTDAVCESMIFDTLEISTFEITEKVISEESIEAYGLNETFIYSSESNDLPLNYTLIYMDTEKLYFGQKSDSNIGETPETRHSSISLDNYFTQIIN